MFIGLPDRAVLILSTSKTYPGSPLTPRFPISVNDNPVQCCILDWMSEQKKKISGKT